MIAPVYESKANSPLVVGVNTSAEQAGCGSKQTLGMPVRFRPNRQLHTRGPHFCLKLIFLAGHWASTSFPSQSVSHEHSLIGHLAAGIRNTG